MSFIFSLNFSLVLIFRCIKPIQKALLSRLYLLEVIVRPFISWFSGSTLEYFENDIHFCQDIWYIVTLKLAMLFLGNWLCPAAFYHNGGKILKAKRHHFAFFT